MAAEYPTSGSESVAADLAIHEALTTTAHGIDTALATKAASTAVETVACLTADATPITSNTTLTNIGLAIPIGASSTEVWHLRGVLLVTAVNTTMDGKLGWTVPSGASGRWIQNPTGSFVQNLSNSPTAATTIAAALTFATANVANMWLPIEALVFGGGTSGNVQLQLAQNTSDAGALTVLRGSHIRALRLAA